MATGEVQLVGTQNSSISFVGLPASNVLDGDFTTSFANLTQSGGYIGWDAGTAVEVTELQATPRQDNSTDGAQAFRLGGLVLEGSNTSATAGLSSLKTVPTLPALRQDGLSPLALALAGSTYRYYELTDPLAQYCVVAEMRLLIKAGTAATARPCRPAISPFGGDYPGARARITITSRTTSAVIYYTIDGSTPTTGSTLYSGAFNLNIGAGSTVTFKAIASDATCSTTTSEVSVATFRGRAWVPKEDKWDTTRGNLSRLNCPCTVYSAGTFYRFGNSAASSTGFLSAGGASADVIGNDGVWLETSTDAINWTVPINILGRAGSWDYALQPQVVYSASDNQWVLWVHGYTIPTGTGDRACVATSASPAGPWTWQTSTLDPDGLGFKDFSLALGSDGTGWVCYTEGDQDAVIISKLAPSMQATTGSPSDRNTLFAGTSGESPTLIEWTPGRWFLIYSGHANYYDSSSTYDPKYVTATDPLGTWSSPADYFSADPVGTDYNGQVRNAFKLPGRAQGWIWSGDYWHGDREAHYADRLVELPLTRPTSSTLSVTTPTSWSFSQFDLEHAPVVSGPSSGASGVASTAFTYALQDGAFFAGDESITISPTDGSIAINTTGAVLTNNGDGTYSISPLLGMTSFSFTYTPASAGSKTLAFTGMTPNPSNFAYNSVGASSGGVGMFSGLIGSGVF